MRLFFFLKKRIMRSRAPKSAFYRKRAPGAGRRNRNPVVRQLFYQWWTSIRLAIDWKTLLAENRSCGLKKNLARFPRPIPVFKVYQLLQYHARAYLLDGQPPQSFKPNSWWFTRWEEEYGLSMRAATRKFAVPSVVLKQRLEPFRVTLFTMRLFVLLDLLRPCIVQI